MRLKSIKVTDVLPVRKFEVDDLSDVVVIAGQNGVGKSRLIGGLLDKLATPPPRQFHQTQPETQPVRLVVEATTEKERRDWTKGELDTGERVDAHRLGITLQSQKSRTKWESSVIYFESDRSVAQINSYSPNWIESDPYGEQVAGATTFAGLKARFQDTINSLFRKVQSDDVKSLRKMKELQSSGAATMPLDSPDPLAPFKEAFELLVGPKRLLPINPEDPQLYYEHEGQRLPINSLSSGEREVINIVFDLILRAPSDCIIFFDEPETHLHPELSFRLLQTLKTLGPRNQFIFCTHSPDIITASLENTVVFIAPPKTNEAGDQCNQAIVVTETDETNRALRLLGQSIGIVSLGKKIVLIEGDSSSLDKQTYGAILKNQFPGLVLVPSGGREVVESFEKLTQQVLSRSLWGVDFFMVCDPDASDPNRLAEDERSAAGRLRYLKRYHLENYFLDSHALAKVFEDFEQEDSQYRNADVLDKMLREIAKETISYAVGLVVSAEVRRTVGNVSIMPKGLQSQGIDDLVRLFNIRVQAESERTNNELDLLKIEARVREKYMQLSEACMSDEWKTLIPGKPVLKKFASKVGFGVGRIKTGYINVVHKHSLSCFDDIVEIFDSFSNQVP